MSAQDKTEQVLREIHILLSRSEVYGENMNRVIVDKKQMSDLLARLSACIYMLMDEYELTQQSRDAADREARKRGEEIVWDASRKAEDVYAASVLYTDEALCRVQDIMLEAAESMKSVYEKMSDEMKKEREIVRRDQSELKSHLQDLVDTEKYLKLIEDRNKEIRREKEREREKERKRERSREQEKEEKELSVQDEPVSQPPEEDDGEKEQETKEKEQTPRAEKSEFKIVKPEIKVNPAYFEKAGIPMEEVFPATGPGEDDSVKKQITPEIKVNLDAEYFRWKEEAGEDLAMEKKAEKHSLFGKLLR